jgi:hypothetical protein
MLLEKVSECEEPMSIVSSSESVEKDEKGALKDEDYHHISCSSLVPSHSVYDELLDLQKLCCFFCEDVYEVRKEMEEADREIDEVRVITDRVTGEERVYEIRRHIFHPIKKSELCCLYTATLKNDGEEEENQLTDSEKKKAAKQKKYAFLVWRGTYSRKQVNLDFHAAIEDESRWRWQLIDIVKLFLNQHLQTYLVNEGISAEEYDWYVSGHSLGGALAGMTGDMILRRPELLNLSPESYLSRIKKVITFASMKVPDPVMIEDRDYIDHNNVIEFFSSWDSLPEEFAPKLSKHLGMVPDTRIDVGYFRLKNLLSFNLFNFPSVVPIPHSLENFQNYFDEL